MSIFPEVLVGVGTEPPIHLIVVPVPAICKVSGAYPVAVCVTSTLIVKILPSVVGAFVTFKVVDATKLFVTKKMLPNE